MIKKFKLVDSKYIAYQFNLFSVLNKYYDITILKNKNFMKYYFSATLENKDIEQHHILRKMVDEYASQYLNLLETIMLLK